MKTVINIDHNSDDRGMFLNFMQPRHILSVFLTSNAEIDNWENFNMVAFKSYIFKKLN